MKILELQLLAFGPFTNLYLDLTAGNHGLHVLFGPNEAGKSSALRALKALLYGIPNTTADNFQHDNPKLRLGGCLRHSDGTELRFVRRKGLKNTLMDLDDHPLPETSLGKFLASVTPELFSTMFGIDHPTLRRGGEEILQGGGEMGETLFSAALGGVSLRQIQQSLDHEARQLFLPQGQNPRINKALTEYRAAKRTIETLSLTGDDWAKHERALQEAMDKRQAVRAELHRLAAEQHRLERLQTAIPKIARRKELLLKRQELRDVVLLPAEFAEQRREAMQKVETAREVAQESLLALEQLAQERQALVVPEALLEQAETIAVLQQRLGSYRKATQDRANLQGRLRQLDVDARALLARLPPALTLEQAKERRLQAAFRARVHELARQYQARVESLDRATKDAQKCAEHLTNVAAALNALDAPRDPSELRQAVARARQQGDLEEAREQVRAELQMENEQAQVELAHLGLWSGALQELAHLPIPSKETVDQYEFTFRTLDTDMHQLRTATQKTQAESAELHRQLDELRLAGSVPSEDDLASARERREHLWTRVRRAWLERHDARQNTDAPGVPPDLATAYEDAVEHADEIADRLRREAERVARQATLTTQHDKAVKTLEQLTADRDLLEAEVRQQHERWRLLWHPAGIMPLPPREMRTWLERHAKLVQRAERVRELLLRRNRLDEHIREHSLALSQIMERLGGQGVAANDPLHILLARSEALIKMIEDTTRQRQAFQQQLTTMTQELERSKRDEQKAAALLTHWQTDWAVALARLGLDGQALPAEANAILEVLDELLKKLDEADGYAQRVEGIDHDAKAFADEAKILVARIAPDLMEAPADQAAVQLLARLAKAQTDATRKTALAKQIQERETMLERAKSTITQMTDRLQALCHQAGCTHPAELSGAEARSAELQQVQKDIAALEQQLIEQSAGATLEQLIQATETIDADALPAQLAEIVRRTHELEAQQSALDQAIGSEQTILGQMDGSAKAAEAAEKAQAIVADLREGVDHYIRLRLASLLLRREIERYRASHQGPLLRRASELFAQLTLGSFAKLETDYNDKDEPVLIGVRADGRQVSVKNMSDGTRDQLYLALRLASLERYLASNEPLPFIVDDILIQFDDRRAEAALQVLAQLSMKTQVIFFTHHRRLAELAQHCGSADAVQIQQLGE